MADLGSVGTASKRLSMGYMSISRKPSEVPSGARTVFGRLSHLSGFGGAVTTKKSNILTKATRIEAVWALSGIYPYLSTNTRGKIQGKVQQGGVDLPNCRVAIFYRPTGALINGTMSAADGSFTFLNLIPSISDYFLVAFDPDGGVHQNALIFDKILSTT